MTSWPSCCCCATPPGDPAPGAACRLAGRTPPARAGPGRPPPAPPCGPREPSGVNGLLEGVLGLASPWAYVVVAVLAGLEAAAFIGLVIPGEAAMLLGGVLAFSGRANLVVMMICAGDHPGNGTAGIASSAADPVGAVVTVRGTVSAASRQRGALKGSSQHSWSGPGLGWCGCRRRRCRRWRSTRCGVGGGERLYSWAWIVLHAEQDGDPGHHHLLIRRNHTTGERAYHRCYTPRPTSLSQLVRVAGQRWRIEESFQAGKGLTGLDQHQVRRWTSWQRWTTLAMLAHAFPPWPPQPNTGHRHRQD